MAEKKAQIVIKKVKKGGHGGAHGGAWKVAYADFVTAMMCFFLVMWLMGADEETKQSISSYFNNPTAAWRPELKDIDTVPLGNQTGAGDTVLKGAEGQTPDALVQKPTPVIPPDNKAKIDADGALSGEEIATADTLSFSFKESELFPKAESAEIARAHAAQVMAKIGKVARSFGGSLVIRGTYDEQAPTDYEFEMSRLVAVQHYVVDQKWLGEDLMQTSLRKRTERRADSERRPSSAPTDDRRIELVFMK
jgi:flagellar motor protein MotB